MYLIVANAFSIQENLMKCANCQKETINPKFCSRSCAASHNNTLNPRRVKTKKCKCGTLILGDRLRCSSCYQASIYHPDDTISSMRHKAKYQKSAVIRDMARRIYRKSSKPKSCANCGYSKHYEVCHIKAINSFSDDALLSEVNNPSNLIALCPNCHWELDNGLIDLVALSRFELESIV